VPFRALRLIRRREQAAPAAAEPSAPEATIAAAEPTPEEAPVQQTQPKTAVRVAETQPYKPGVPPVRSAPTASAATNGTTRKDAPATTDVTGDGGVVEVLERIQDNLMTLGGEHRQRVVEFKVSVAEGLRQALGVMEVQADRLTELLKSNQGLTRSVVSMARDISKSESMLSNVEEQVSDLRERRDALSSRLAEMVKRRDGLKSELKGITDEHAAVSEKNIALREQISKLDHDNELLKRESEKLDKTKTRLQADVERLLRLRDEYQANIERFKKMQSELTQGGN
jgi:hypothetical protein